MKTNGIITETVDQVRDKKQKYMKNSIIVFMLLFLSCGNKEMKIQVHEELYSVIQDQAAKVNEAIAERNQTFQVQKDSLVKVEDFGSIYKLEAKLDSEVGQIREAYQSWLSDKIATAARQSGLDLEMYKIINFRDIDGEAWIYYDVIE